MAGEKRGGSVLSQLRYPLVFFGLSLLMIESTFGFCLARYSYSERITVALASWMGTLFIVVTVIVALLTYMVPEHIMLQAQMSTTPDVLSAIKRMRETLRVLSSTEEPKSFEALSAMLDQLEMILGSGN